MSALLFLVDFYKIEAMNYVLFITRLYRLKIQKPENKYIPIQNLSTLLKYNIQFLFGYRNEESKHPAFLLGFVNTESHIQLAWATSSDQSRQSFRWAIDSAYSGNF